MNLACVPLTFNVIVLINVIANHQYFLHLKNCAIQYVIYYHDLKISCKQYFFMICKLTALLDYRDLLKIRILFNNENIVNYSNPLNTIPT